MLGAFFVEEICMKAIRCNLPFAEVIEIHPLADLHIGDGMCDFKLIMERIEHIKNTPNAYCILDGDLMDTAIASSIGDTYGANLQPMEQLKQCVKIFEPIKDKILAVLPGNHENRVYKSDGLDITELMCNQLDIAEKYSSTTALLFIRFGKNKAKHHGRPILYTAYVTHGSGGGRREGGKVNRLADLASIVDADIYIHAHTHLPIIFKESFFRVSGSNSSVALADKLFVNTAASLNYGGYGDKAGFKPASKSSPVIYLDGLKHDMWAKL
jgi:predicted MPP superfamily phosphohydrolase